jgi:branched-chain amino acid transport system substrate-binding protein
MKFHLPGPALISRRVLIRLLLAGITAGCTQPLRQQDQAKSSEIWIGIIASLTGDAAQTGELTVKGAELAVKEINQMGGLAVGGQRYNIVLKIEDDQDEVDVAVNAARKLIYRENVVAIVGPQYSRNAIPVAKFVENAKIPMISPVSTNPETTQGKRYVFRATFIDPFQGQVMAQFAYHDLRAETAAVLYDIASAYNQGIAQVFKQVFEAEGGSVVAFESYTTGEKQFKTQLTTIEQLNPDVLFLPNYIHEVPLQIMQARQLGIQSTLLGPDSWEGLQMDDHHFLEGAFYSTQYAPDTKNPKTQAFIQQYQQAYGEQPNGTAATTYDTMHLLFQSMQNQGKVDANSIQQGLSKLGRYEGVTGTIEYRGTGDPIRSAVILQIKDNRTVFYKQVNP